MNEFRGVIFDMDGTILDSMEVWDKIDADFLKARGIEVPEDYAAAISTMTVAECAVYTINRFKLENDTIETLSNEWNERALFEYGNNLSLKKGAKRYIEKLKARGVKIALATSSSKLLCEAAMKHTGVFELFDVVISTDEIGISKNEPRVYTMAAEMLEVPIEECAVFEDVPRAVCCAKSTGAYIIGVWDRRWRDNKNEIVSIADRFIYDFDEME